MKNRINRKLGFESLEPRIVLSANYFVSPTGSDAGAGTLAQPFATIEKAYSSMVAGDTAYFRGGVYDITSRVLLQNKSGNAGNLLSFVPYQNEQPVFDFTTAASNGAVPSGGFFYVRNTDYLHMDGFELLRTGSDPNEPRRDAIYFIDVNNSTIENFNVHHFAGNGLNLLGSHDNLVLNSDVHNNVVNNSSHADGFWIGDGSYDNTYRGNRAYHNNDDGFDFWDAGSGNLLEDNWAFEQGKDSAGNPIAGDGHGFKLGRGPGQNTLVRNLSWGNRESGFTENGNTSILTLYNNTTYDNGLGWQFYTGQQDVLRNNLSYLDSGSSFNGADDQFNSWNYPGLSITASDFVTLDDTANRAPRQADGSLPVSNFLHLAAGSNTINAGVDVGLPFDGAAPDLGAFEWSVVPSSADFDNDGDVDGADFLSWQRGFGTPAPVAVKSDGDANNDQAVDGEDLAVWTVQFGNPPPSSAALSTSVIVAPEIAPSATQAAPLSSLGVLARADWFQQEQPSNEQVIDVDNAIISYSVSLPQVTAANSVPSESNSSLENSPLNEASDRKLADLEAAFEELSGNLESDLYRSGL